MSRFFAWCRRLFRDLRRALRRPVVRRLALTLLFLWMMDGAIGLLCEAQWQESLGFGAAFRTRILTQGLLFCGTAFVALGLAAWPLRVFAALPAARLELPERYAWVERRLAALSRFDVRSLQILVLALTFFTAQDAARHWPQILLFNGDDWGVRATPWHLDAALWTFSLPGMSFLLDAAGRAVNIALLAALPSALGRGMAQFLTRRSLLPRGAIRCLALLGALWFACRASRFLLAPFDLVLSPSGLTFLDWLARWPVLWLGSALNAIAALLLLAASVFRVRVSLVLRGSLAALIALARAASRCFRRSDVRSVTLLTSVAPAATPAAMTSGTVFTLWSVTATVCETVKNRTVAVWKDSRFSV